MSTTELLEKLKDGSKGILALKDLKPSPGALDYVFTVAGIVLKTRSLISDGVAPTLTELLLPHLVTTFGPPLIANSVYRRFHPTAAGLAVYTFGFVLSLLVQSSRTLMFVIREIPHISRFFSLVSLKNTKDNVSEAFGWAITADFAGQFLSKVVLKKSFRVKVSDLVKTATTYGGVFLLREYEMPDYMVIVVANMVPLAMKLVESMRHKEEPEGTKRRTPKRKASLAVQLEKSK